MHAEVVGIYKRLRRRLARAFGGMLKKRTLQKKGKKEIYFIVQNLVGTISVLSKSGQVAGAVPVAFIRERTRQTSVRDQSKSSPEWTKQSANSRCKLYRQIISPASTIGIIIVRCGLYIPAHFPPVNAPSSLVFLFISLSLSVSLCHLSLPVPSLSLQFDILQPLSNAPATNKTHDHINEPNKSRLNGFCLNKECPVNCNRSSTADALITKAIIVTNVKYR